MLKVSETFKKSPIAAPLVFLILSEVLLDKFLVASEQ